jgi:hypothetical protein
VITGNVSEQVSKMEDLKTKVKSLYEWGFLYLAPERELGSLLQGLSLLFLMRNRNTGKVLEFCFLVEHFCLEV